MMQDTTTASRRTKAYMNLARAEWPQEFGQAAQVVLTQVPVRQQARLLRLKTPPISDDQKLVFFVCVSFA